MKEKLPPTPIKQKIYLHMSDGTILFVEVEQKLITELQTEGYNIVHRLIAIDDLIINTAHIVYITLPSSTVSENQTTTPEEENLAQTQPYIGSN